MDKREAKRMVCSDLAGSMVEMIAEGEIRLDLPSEDRERYVEGFCDLAEELLRRSGVDVSMGTSEEVDDRQITIFEALEATHA